MFTKFQIGKWFTAIIVIIVIVMGVSSFEASAADADNDNTVSVSIYLPLVVQLEGPELTSPPSDSPDMDFEEQVVALTNEERLAHGCGPVTMDNRLLAAAEGHSEDLALNDFFSHTGSDGSTPWDRILAQGYSFSLAGENIAAGFSSPLSVVTGWMNSDGHRANILNCEFTNIGVGYFYYHDDVGNVNYQHYWTQVFASP